MLSNAADSQKAISYLLLGLFQGTPAWQRLASLQSLRLTKIQTVAAKILPTLRVGGGGLQQSIGACGRAGVPVTREGCKLERLQVPVLPKCSIFPSSETRKKKRRGAQRWRSGCLRGGLCACPFPRSRSISGYRAGGVRWEREFEESKVVKNKGWGKGRESSGVKAARDARRAGAAERDPTLLCRSVSPRPRGRAPPLPAEPQRVAPAPAAGMRRGGPRHPNVFVISAARAARRRAPTVRGEPARRFPPRGLLAPATACAQRDGAPRPAQSIEGGK